MAKQGMSGQFNNGKHTQGTYKSEGPVERMVRRYKKQNSCLTHERDREKGRDINASLK